MMTAINNGIREFADGAVAFVVLMAICLAFGTAKDVRTQVVSVPGVQTVMAATAE